MPLDGESLPSPLQSTSLETATPAVTIAHAEPAVALPGKNLADAPSTGGAPLPPSPSKPAPPSISSSSSFSLKPGETPAEALRRRLREKKEGVVAVAVAAPVKENDVESVPVDKMQSNEDDEEKFDCDYKPNIFFQNARYSSCAPRPEVTPRHQQLPRSIHFFIRVTDVDPINLEKPLPERVKGCMLTATTISGSENAGPMARVDFSKAKILGVGSRLAAVMAGHPQVCTHPCKLVRSKHRKGEMIRS